VRDLGRFSNRRSQREGGGYLRSPLVALNCGGFFHAVYNVQERLGKVWLPVGFRPRIISADRSLLRSPCC
jgi:hypothetical protein